MFDLQKLIRPHLAELKPYSSARDEFSGTEGIFLDANENPFGKLNRYPDPHQKKLKQQLSIVKNIDPENIFIGNGSDEVIDLIYRLFCVPATDKAIAFTPTYGMYEVSAAVNDVHFLKLALTENFQINIEELKTVLDNENIKLIFICSPNNPTGNIIENIDWILQNFNGIVVVDEAYIDFSFEDSYSSKIAQYPNLIVLQTLSKAWALASVRVGLALSNAAIIKMLNKIKPPYNVSAPNQEAAWKALKNYKTFTGNIQTILMQRIKLQNALEKISCVKKIYPSDANFLLVEVTDANTIYEMLIEKKLITRNRAAVIKNCIRITVGSNKENKELIKVLKKISIKVQQPL